MPRNSATYAAAPRSSTRTSFPRAGMRRDRRPASGRRRLMLPRVSGRALRTLAVAATLATTAAGCGGTGGGGPAGPATLVLDFMPNAVHAGIYSTLVRNFDEGEGVQLRVRQPSSSTDSVKLLAVRADRLRDPRHPRPGDRARQGQGPRRRHGPRPAPIGGGHRTAGDPLPARARGQAGGRHGVAVRRRRARVGRRRGWRRPGEGPQGHDRLQRRAEPPHPPRLGCDRVLERRGRRAPGRSGRTCASSGSTSSAPRPTPSSSSARPATTVDERPDLVRGVVRSLVRGYGVTVHDPESSASRPGRQRQGPRPQAHPEGARRADHRVRRSREGVRRAGPGAPAGMGGVGEALRRGRRGAGRGARVRRLLPARLTGQPPPASLATSDSPSRAIRERGTTMSKPASRPRSRARSSTWE